MDLACVQDNVSTSTARSSARHRTYALLSIGMSMFNLLSAVTHSQCDQVNKKMKSISFTRTLEQISELDCHIAFATVSLQYEWSLPTVVEE